MKTLQVTIKGTTSLILHNKAFLADSESELAKEIGSKLKTKDIETVKWLSWYGSLYLNDNKEIVIPSYVLHACLVGGGKPFKLGKKVKGALFIDNDVLLNFEKPEELNDLESLYKSGLFTNRTLVKVNNGLIPRIRPEFKNWSLKFTVQFDTDDFSKDEIENIVETAGRISCLGDWRPYHGKFEVVEIKEMQ